MRIYTYQPDDGRRHCREAMAYQCDNGRLVDTFWGVPGDSSVRHTLTDTELATAVPLFNTDDYDEIDRHMRDSSTWESYAPTDRARITSQHGLQTRWFIRKGANPDLETMIGNAEEDLDRAQHRLRALEFGIASRKRRIADLKAQR